MKQRIITLVMLAGLVTMLAGCSETFSVKKGEQVRLTVLTDTDPGTKTSYAGYESGATYERIRWNVGDNIRIFSMNTDIVKAKWLDPSKNNDFYYYDYKISSSKDSTDNNNNKRYNKGKLTWGETGAGEGYGMVWLNDPYGATLYGVYPSADTVDQGGKIVAFKNMTIPASQGAAPDMSHAYMISGPSEYKPNGTDQYGQNIPYMEMKFYPFFNAFYIELKSDSDNGIKINSVTLTSTSDGLSGDYKYLFLEDNGIPAVGNVTYNMTASSNVTKSVTADLSSMSDTDRTATSSHAVGVTLLTLPPMSSTGLTNMTLTVNYDNNKSKSLALNNNVTTSNPAGTPINFKPFYKARLTGLAMEGGSKWQLIIDDQVLPWIADEETTSFRTQIGIKDKSMTGMVEIDASNPDPNCGRNEYEAANGYEKYYQIRTVQLGQLGGADPHIEFEFTPTAPIGGYWSLSVESASPNAADYFKVTVFDGINEESERLQGQVMSIPVKIYIRPSELFRTSTEAAVHSILIHCNVSPSKDFDPTYSADSEFQDVHGDGRYSYWKFRLIKD